MTTTNWKQVKHPLGMLTFENGELSAIVTTSVERDKNVWLHVSVAHPSRLPTYVELQEVKDVFIGQNKKAIQVFPPRNEHVNLHPYCLHLWCCLSANPIPDFRKMGMI